MNVYIVCKLRCKSTHFQQIRTPSCNRLTRSYFSSVTGYNSQTSFTALRQRSIVNMLTGSILHHLASVYVMCKLFHNATTIIILVIMPNMELYVIVRISSVPVVNDSEFKE